MPSVREEIIAQLKQRLPFGAELDLDIRDESSLTELGLTSLQFINMLLVLQHRYELDPDSLGQFGSSSTVRDLVTLFESSNKAGGVLRNWAPTFERAPLTHQQMFFFRLFGLMPVSITVRLTGAVDHYILCWSLQELITRHDSLRTKLIVVDGTPQQHVIANKTESVRVMSFDEFMELREREKRRFSPGTAVGTTSNDTADGLFGIKLAALPTGETLLTWSIDHVMIDGTSLNLLFRELWSLYAELVRGSRITTGATLDRYVNYAVWQREQEHAWSTAHEPYWLARLDGAARLQWRHSQRTEGGSLCSASTNLLMKFGKGLRAGLENVARALAAPVPMVMLTVYVALVFRWCGIGDFVVPVIAANRDNSDYLCSFGFFAYPLYLRVVLSGQESFLDLLKLLSEEHRRAEIHQDFGRMAARYPNLLEGTVFQWCPWGLPEEWGMLTPRESLALDMMSNIVEPDLRHITGKAVLCDNAPTPFDLSVSFYENDDGILANFEGNSDIFPEATIDTFARHLQALSEKVAADPYNVRVSGDTGHNLV